MVCLSSDYRDGMMHRFASPRLHRSATTPRIAGILMLALLAGSLCLSAAQAQETDFDPFWYEPSRTYVKVAVTEDGVYRITGEDLATLGVSPSSIQPGTLQLFENGREIPLWYTGDGGSVGADAEIFFVGKRNRGDGEAWAYRDNPDWQSSTYYSLYTDTTFYWLAWGGAQGQRYRTSSTSQTFPEVSTFRDTVHLESEALYYDGAGSDAENPFYTQGEGTYWQALGHAGGSTAPTIFNTSTGVLNDLVATGDSLYLTARLFSFTASRHRFTLELETTANGTTAYSVFDEEDWTGYAFRTLRAAIAQTEVRADRNLPVRLTSFNEFGASVNGTYLDWIEASYVRELVAAGGRLRFSYPDAAARTLTVRGFGNAPVLVFNPNDQRLFELTPSAGSVVFSDRPTQPPVYWATSTDAVRAPAALSVDRSSDWADPTNEADYVILTTRALRPSAQALADYRRARNGFKVATVDVQDVFDQFGYGLPTPLAIRRFVHHTQGWRTRPAFLVFWGDALYPDRTRKRAAWEVPSYGKASSDGWFGMQAGGPEDWTEMIAIGRLTIREDAEGLLFLQKLEAYESAPLDDWQKRMLMLVGGRGVNEQNTLQNFVRPWESRALAAPTGMDTLNFFRDSDAPIDDTFQDSMRVALRRGASWLSYFGHSAATTWEIVVDEPEDFNNAARLPLVLSLGCRTGAFAGGRNAQADIRVLAEKLVIGSLNGSIAHWGTSGLGSISASARLGDLTHQLVFSDTLRTIGKIFQEAKRRYVAAGAISLRDLVQFGMIGDPATQLAIPNKPDFHLVQEQLRITPLEPVPADEALTVSVRLRNRGLVPPDSITLQLTHTDPDGKTTPYSTRVAPFRLEQEVLFTVPIDSNSVGEHAFQVVVDPENAYQEMVEINNSAERTHAVFSSQLTLVAPRNLGAVAAAPFRLRVAFTAQSAEGTPIRFELDDAPTFDSPNLRTFDTVAPGSFAIWSFTESLPAGRPYYWRARTNLPGDPVNWQTASFFVEPAGLPANTWTQSSALFDFNTQDANLAWEEDRWVLNDYDVEVKVAASGFGGAGVGEILIDGIRYERLGLGFGMLTLDGNKGSVRAHISTPLYPNPVKDPVVAREEFNTFIAALRDGDYLFVRTRNVGFQGAGPEIPQDVKAIFRSLGSTAIDTLTYDDLWILRTRVGHPEETAEWVEPYRSSLTDIFHTELIFFQQPEGQTESPPIGPARRWTSLDWDAVLPNADSEVRIDVLDDADDTVLLEGLTTPEPADLSFLDAQQHPYLRLRATLSDSSQQATPQLTRWSMNYASIPELVLDRSSLTLSADTVQETQPVTLSASIYNLSDDVAEDVLLTLELTDAENRTSLVGADTLQTLAPDATATATFSLSTEGLIGRNILTMRAEQAGLEELLTFNNIALTEFSVRGDREPPTLRVTLDGEEFPNDPEPIRDLQDQDIPQLTVRPIIEIVFADDNEFQPLNDTTLARITLNGERVAFNRPDVTFIPATASQNEARIIFTPDFSGQDAVFTLNVEVFDASGNEAEGSPYQVHFRVESTFRIETVYPYPNPMSSFTQFAFRLRGSDTSVIEDFRIRIYTLTGRVVREFDLIEDPSQIDGGSLHIGWNKLYWDGRDEDSDLLATGVYLYKVFLQAEGRSVEVNNERSLEKLVIIR